MPEAFSDQESFGGPKEKVYNCHHKTKQRQEIKLEFNWITDCFVGTYGVLCLFCFMLENSCLTQLEFQACAIIHDQLECRLFCKARIFCYGKFLHEAVGILSLCNCSSSIGLHIVFLGTHSVLSALFRIGKFMLGPVGILSLCNYFSSIGLHIVLFGTHGDVPLFYFAMKIVA